MKDYYGILGVIKKVNLRDWEATYQKLSAVLLVSNLEEDQIEQSRADIVEAYETLSDAEKRRDYGESFKNYEINNIESKKKPAPQTRI